mmetsp:Transcript_4922/g.21159  ORF Transcript_4922/g.21159 Transcript_4922/m.21159 type:complete len:243 (+) Transcript_4922:2011-2739(+)
MFALWEESFWPLDKGTESGRSEISTTSSDDTRLIRTTFSSTSSSSAGIPRNGVTMHQSGPTFFMSSSVSRRICLPSLFASSAGFASAAAAVTLAPAATAVAAATGAPATSLVSSTSGGKSSNEASKSRRNRAWALAPRTLPVKISLPLSSTFPLSPVRNQFESPNAVLMVITLDAVSSSSFKNPDVTLKPRTATSPSSSVSSLVLSAANTATSHPNTAAPSVPRTSSPKTSVVTIPDASGGP